MTVLVFYLHNKSVEKICLETKSMCTSLLTNKTGGFSCLILFHVKICRMLCVHKQENKKQNKTPASLSSHYQLPINSVRVLGLLPEFHGDVKHPHNGFRSPLLGGTFSVLTLFTPFIFTLARLLCITIDKLNV